MNVTLILQIVSATIAITHTLCRNARDVKNRHWGITWFLAWQNQGGIETSYRDTSAPDRAACFDRNIAINRCNGRYLALYSHLNHFQLVRLLVVFGGSLSHAALKSGCCSPECVLLWRPCIAVLTRWARMMWTTECISEWLTSSKSKISPSSFSTGRTLSHCWHARCSVWCTLRSQGKKLKVSSDR